MKVPKSVKELLGECRIEGQVLYLPNRQLPRNEYQAVHRVLKFLGGVWDRKAQGHVFKKGNLEEMLNTLLQAGEITDKKKQNQFFPTPTEVGIFLCDLAELDSTTSVIEPECGRGDLADVIWARSPKSLLGIENNLEMQPFLCHKPYQVLYRDFLEIRPGELETDRFIMNPPFSHQQDIKHVLHAFELLKPGGILVSVISESVFYLEWKVVKQFREFMQDKEAVNYKLESGTFKASGTMIPTRVIKIRKDKSTTNENIPSGTPAAD